MTIQTVVKKQKKMQKNGSRTSKRSSLINMSMLTNLAQTMEDLAPPSLWAVSFHFLDGNMSGGVSFSLRELELFSSDLSLKEIVKLRIHDMLEQMETRQNDLRPEHDIQSDV